MIFVCLCFVAVEQTRARIATNCNPGTESIAKVCNNIINGNNNEYKMNKGI